MTAKLALIIPDQHIREHDTKALSIILTAIRVLKPDTVINIGDIGENEGSSHWKWKRRAKPPLEYIIPDVDEDLRVTNQWLDLLDDAMREAKTKKKVLTCGNHDKWLDYMCESYPVLLKQGYGVRDAYKLDARGYEFVEYGHYHPLGDWLFYHGGHYTNMHHTKSHLERVGQNIMYAHHHNYRYWSIARMEGFIEAHCLGFLGAFEKEFLQGNLTDWQHMFATVAYDDEMHGTVHIYRIQDGLCEINGKVYDGTNGEAECLNQF
jgi:hypothetical protein